MQRTFALFKIAYQRFDEDDGWAIASHIALAGLTSMFQFLIFLTALAGFLGSKEMADQVTSLMFEAWPAVVAAPLAAEIHNVLTQTHGGLLTLGAVLALYFSSSAVEALRIGLNRAYNVRDMRGWWMLRLESIAFVLLGSLAALALGFLIVLGPLIWANALKYAPALGELFWLVNLVRYAITALILAATLLLAHKYLAAGRRRFGDIWPGVVLTFVLSLLFAEVFGSYLAAFASNYVTTYAGLASAMVALVFLYSLAAIFVYGAELNAVMMSRRR